ncbi:hypothetical protein K501DRAFT_228178 [Backusella circina FSU 941]|nr:hypothetical protein K501DRAFT_228178 [Backusella circina FSU 941]
MEQEIHDGEVVRFFNAATSQEIQEVTGCRPDAAEKLINQLRPFRNMQDLEGRLKSEKGVSVTFISSYKSVQMGYSATDRIIEKVEHIGKDLGNILEVWKGEMSAASSRQGSPDSDEDAMDGYLTTQPTFVNPEMTLKDYQIMGVNWMLLLYRKNISGILADEMGLGKTAQVISFLARLYEMGDEGLHLIVVPSSTIENWVREFGRFAPKLQVRTYHGSQSERASLQIELVDEYDDYQVLVTTYNIATSNESDRTFLRRLNCQTMILDEGHMVKNCFSSRYQNLKKIKAPFRLLLTGTPLQNSLQELISLLTFIMPETFDQFKDKLEHVFKVKSTYSKGESGKRDSTTTASQMLSRKRIQRAKQMMTPFVLRRRKLDVLKDLPQKIHVQEQCTMTHGQQKLYHTIVRESKKTFEEEGRKRVVKNTDMEAQYSGMSNIIVHLRKAADHPMLFRNLYDDAKIKIMAKEIMKDVRYWDSEEQYIYEDMTIMSDFELNRLCLDHKAIKRHALEKKSFMDSGKVKKLCELLKKYKNNKVLIFSQFTKMLDILEVVMKQVDTPYLRLDGETKVMERQALIDQFNEDKDIPVFLLSTKAGGFGINLTSANIVILFDMDFNPQNDKQAEDRAHRVGQTQDVTIIRLISKNSIEEYILKMAEIKLRLDKRISAADGEEDENIDDTENEKKNLREILQNEFKNVE